MPGKIKYHPFRQSPPRKAKLLSCLESYQLAISTVTKRKKYAYQDISRLYRNPPEKEEFTFIIPPDIVIQTAHQAKTKKKRRCELKTFIIFVCNVLLLACLC